MDDVSPSDIWDLIIQFAQFGKAMTNLESLTPDVHRTHLKTFFMIAKTLQRMSDGQISQQFQWGVLDAQVQASFEVRYLSDNNDSSPNVNRVAPWSPLATYMQQLRGFGFTDDEIKNLTGYDPQE